MKPTVYEGCGDASNLKVAIVVSRFNDAITRALLEGALGTFKRHNLAVENGTVVWVPGAFELPLVAQQLAGSGHYDTIVCLGAVIRGATDHYDYVCSAVASGVSRVGLDSGIPIIFGVLTTHTLEQALERAGGKSGNKGSESALAAIEMALLMRQLKGI